MKIEVYNLIEGAKQAHGLTVIIDVFRAFSLEPYLFDAGAKEIIPVGQLEEAYELKKVNPDYVLVGERKGKKCEGFDLGNSPSNISREIIKDKTLVHTTSAGTQGIANAVHADEIITGALVNAKAIAKYIKAKNPEVVSLVCMGNLGIRSAAEDELCAAYIKSLVEDKPMEDIDERIQDLQYHGGEHFFNPDTQEIFPEEDFYLCIKRDIFDFVLRVEGNHIVKVEPR